MPAAAGDRGGPLAAPVWTFDAGSPLWAGADVRRRNVSRGRPGRTAPRGGRALRAEAVVVPGGRADPHAADGGRRGRSTSRRTTASSTSSTRRAGKSVAGPRGREADRAAAVRQPEVAVRPLRVGRDGRRRAALPRHARRARGRDRPGAGREGLGVRLRRQRARGARPWRAAASSSAASTGTSTRSSRRPGRSSWKRDTKGAVVSTPAVAGDRVVVGNRGYDLAGPRRARPASLPGRATSGSPGSSRRPPCGTASPTSARRTPRPSTPSTREPASGAGRPTSTAGPGASRRSRTARVYAGTASQEGYLAGHKGLRRGAGPGDGTVPRGTTSPSRPRRGLRLSRLAGRGRRARVRHGPRRQGVRLHPVGASRAGDRSLTHE